MIKLSNALIMIALISLIQSQLLQRNPIFDPITGDQLPFPKPIIPPVIRTCPGKCNGFVGSQVCGKNGITYDNECLAFCARTAPAYPGPCLDCSRIRCSFKFFPVCGTDGLTHRNLCTLICVDKVGFASDGFCPNDPNACVCPTNVQLVQLINGICFRHPCLGNCPGIYPLTYLNCNELNSLENPNNLALGPDTVQENLATR